MQTRFTALVRVSTIALATATLLAACGKKEESAGGQASQVAAKVGGSEISVHQINQVLSRTPLNSNSKEAVQAASQQVLERLIDQQLAVDQATEQKLHRSPEVVAQLEAARREVLARAYLQQVISAAPKPDDEEIRNYYNANPALFAERRVYNLQELRIPAAGPVLDNLQTMVKEQRRIEEFAELLRQRGIPFNGGTATRAAEQLPLDLLPRMHALKDGQSIVVAQGSSATVVRLAGSRTLPITEEAARPGISQFLANRRSSETVANEIKRLREATPISYVGDFDRAAAKPAADKDSAASAPAPAAAPAAAPASVTDEGKGGGNADAGVLERGLQGLK